MPHSPCSQPELEEEGSAHPEPLLSPTLFIEVIHHPHSGNQTSTVIHLGASTEKQNASVKCGICIPVCGKPWAPFERRSDFEFAEVAVTKGFMTPIVKTLLNGYQGAIREDGQIIPRLPCRIPIACKNLCQWPGLLSLRYI